MNFNPNKHLPSRVSQALLILLLTTLSETALAMDTDTIMTAVKTRHMPEIKKLDGEIQNLSAEERHALLQKLMESLKSSDWKEQANAAHICGVLGPEAAPASDLLVASMDAKMNNVADAAAVAIGKIGKSAVPSVVAALKLPNRSMGSVWKLMKAVEALGPTAKDAVPASVQYLVNGANTGAVRALRKVGPAAYAALCQGLATESDSRAWVYAIEVFQDSPDQAAAPFAAMLKNKSKTAQAAASYILAQLANDKFSACIPGLLSALRSDDNDIASGAQQALIRIGAAAAKAVRPLVQDDDIKVQRRVAAILQELPADAAVANKPLGAALSDKNPETASMAAATLLKSNAGNKAALSKLLLLLSDSNAKNRSMACRAFGKVGANAAQALQPLIIALKEDTDPHVRCDAATAMGDIGAAASSASAALAEAAVISHPAIDYGRELIGMDDTIHEAAITALRKIGPKASGTVPTLIKILNSGARSTSEIDNVLQTLASMKQAAAPALPSITNFVKPRSPSMKSAISALLAIGPASKSAIPALAIIAADQNEYGNRVDAFQAILKLETKTENKRALISKYLNDSDYSMKNAAAEACAALPAGTASKDMLPTLLTGIKSNQMGIKLSSIKAIGALGPTAAEALPDLIKENIGSSYMNQQRDFAFEAIKKIDPSGSKVIPMLSKAINDPFQVRGAITLLEYIGSEQTKQLASSTREHWKIKN